MLIFSTSKITNVTVKIDNKKINNIVRNVKGPLYAVKWQPNLYKDYLHTITVIATVCISINRCIIMWQ